MRPPRTLKDARSWLREIPEGFGADRFADEGTALEFVHLLYDRGAVEVSVSIVDGDSYASTLIVQMPQDAAARAQIFALLQEEQDRCNEDFSADPNGRTGREMTAEEAEEIGNPDLEGYWLEDDGPLVDVGQQTMELWWD